MPVDETVLLERAERLLAALERGKRMLEEQAGQGYLQGDITDLKVKIGKIDTILETFRDVKLDVLAENVKTLMEDRKTAQERKWAVWLMVLGVIIANVWPLVLLLIRR